MSEKKQSQHVKELRLRLKHSAYVFIILTAIGLYLSGDILSWFQSDLGYSLHALTAYETFITKITIGLLFGGLLSAPATAYQLTKFAKPGLKPSEYRILRNYLPLSILLFAAGAAFSYELIVKRTLDFFMSTTMGAGVESVWSIKRTVGFAIKLSSFTGLMFQLPIVSVVISRAGLIDAEDMREYRTYFIVGVLLTSALATPPDMISQLLVTLPVIGLYELSILLVSRTSG